MKVYRTLKIPVTRLFDEIVYVGQANTQEEINQVFRLRYDVYSERGYINPATLPNNLETDEYDDKQKCVYFIARTDKKIIGTVRLIIDDPLPTEEDFLFTEPEEMKSIARNNRAELGRLIVVPLNKEDKIYFPRNIIMLLLLEALINYGLENHIEGGYCFVKKSLEKKMKKLSIPFCPIKTYTQKYPKDGILWNYFNQTDNPVLPIYFITSNMKKYIEKTFKNFLIFKNEKDNCLVLKNNIYTRFLKSLKII